jgi:hypothetical protein
MPAGENWSQAEVSAAVSDYMQMLTLQLAGQAYNKTEHRRALLSQLAGRSHGSVELKHQNISAVLNELGLFWIPGYKPRGNYQQLLADEVVTWLSSHPEFDRHALAAAEAPAVTPPHWDFSAFEEAKPELIRRPYRVEDSSDRPKRGFFRDYLACEARNSSLGKAGEELAVKYERERLSRAGHDRLADSVEHVARSQGDGLGFDILSYEPSGEERFIEVKTTAFAKETPFFASASEVTFARRNAPQFHLYRLFLFKSAPKCFVLPGALEQHCALDPHSFRCAFK